MTLVNRSLALSSRHRQWFSPELEEALYSSPPPVLDTDVVRHSEDNTNTGQTKEDTQHSVM